MSKLVDKLRGLSSVSATPLGFHTAAGKTGKPALVLIAGLSGAGPEEAKVLVNGNVDAGLILNQNFDVRAIEQVVKSAGDIPVGVLLGDTDSVNLEELVDVGCDFVVFDIKMPVSVLQSEKIGKFLMVDPSLDQGLVRVVNDLDIDGVLVKDSGETAITVGRLLFYQRLAGLLPMPVVMALPSSATNDEATSLWKAGIDSMLILATRPAEVFAELKKAVENLPKRNKHRHARLDVLLPHHAEGLAAEEEEDEEEEEEET